MTLPLLSRGLGRSWHLCGLLLGIAIAPALAQTGGVGIGTTAPDLSAALDIVSSTKGLLLPRVPNATALATPAPGLLVYQTGVPAGFYYNAGTAAAPSWQQLATVSSAVVTATNGLTKTGSAIGLGGALTGPTAIGLAGYPLALTGAGNVGIGTSSPASKLDVSGTLRSLLANGSFQTNDFGPNAAVSTVLLGTWQGNDGNGPQMRFLGAGAGTNYLDIGQNGNGDFVVEGNDVARLTVLNAGNVGIGVSTPTTQLTNTNGNTIGTDGNGGNNGSLSWAAVQNGFVGQFYNGNTTGAANGVAVKINGTDPIAIALDVSKGAQGSIGTPLLTVKAGGNVGIGTNSPVARLDIQGGANSNGTSDPGALAFSFSGGGFRHFVRSRHNGTITGGGNDLDFFLNSSSSAAGSSAAGAGNVQVLTLESNSGQPRVGVGTTTPITQLTNTSVNTIGTDGNGGNSGSLSWAAVQNGFVGQFYNGNTTGAANGVAVKVDGTDASAIALDVSKGAQGSIGLPLLTVKAGGNVGIGTSSPASKLDVSGTLRSLLANGSFQTNDFGPNVAVSTVLLGTWQGNDGNGPQMRFLGAGAGTNYLDIGQNGNGDFVVEGNDVARLTVLNAGNVGIGISTPTSTLQVAGSVAAPIRALSGGTIAATDYTVLVTGNVSLPAPSASNTGRLYHLLNGNTTNNTITGTLRDAGTAGSFPSFTLGTSSGGKGITVQSDGTQWWILTRE